MKTVLIVAAVGVLVAACGAQPQTGPGNSSAPADLKGRVFVSQTVNEKGQVKPLADGTQIRLEFDDHGQLKARAGCNHLFGQVDTSGARLAVTGLGQTDMGCDKALLDQDEWLAGFINSKPGWELTGDTLKLRTADAEIVLGVKPVTPLEGPMWVLQGSIENGTSASGSTRAWLSLNNRTALLTTECDTVEGSYQATVDKITFRDLTSTGGSCPQVNEVTPMLDGEIAYQLDEETLTFTRPDGKGLQFRVGTTPSFMAGKDFVSVDGKTRLSFKDGKLTASVGCNDMTGSVVADNGKLVVQSLGKTRKACEPELMEQEDKLAEFLKSLPDVDDSVTQIRLRTAQTEILFRKQ